MVSEKDLPEINRAVLDGYEVRIRKTADGIKIVAEKTKVRIIKNGRILEEI